MIPRAAIQAWSTTRPWPTLVAVEQDLVLARLIVEIAQHPLLGEELVFRGGTCLHQVVLDRPRRYSEDLDFVRSTHSGIGPLLDAVRDVADTVGLHVAGTNIGAHPKIRLRAPSETDPVASLRIKVEINTQETSPALPTIRMPFLGGGAPVQEGLRDTDQHVECGDAFLAAHAHRGAGELPEFGLEQLAAGRALRSESKKV